MKRFTHLILSLALVGSMIPSCQSPLDADGPRIETPLTAAPKIVPSSIEATFNTANGDYAFQGVPKILLDTSVAPVRVWMDFEMSESTQESDPLVQEFSVNVDSLPADGYSLDLYQGEVKFTMDVGSGAQVFPCNESVNTATILVKELPLAEGEPRKITITIYMIANKDGFFDGYSQEQLFGTIELEI